jgi:5'-nucleotidase
MNLDRSARPLDVRFLGAAMACALLAGVASAQPARTIRSAPPAASAAPAATRTLAQPIRVNQTLPPASVDFYLTVLHHNDGESRLLGAGPGALANFGGVARFKTLADNLRAAALTFPPGPEAKGSVFISSGDNFLAGPEFTVSLNRGTLPYFDTLAMDLIGYDAVTIGNHEFDFGPDVTRDFIAGFTGPFRFITANLDFTGEPGLQAFVNSGRLAKSTVVTVAGRQIGIIGATTERLPFISSPRNVVVDPNVRAAVQAEADRLTNLGVNIIILSSHLQSLTEEYSLVPQLRNVDLVIAGGGSELLANPSSVLVPGDTAFGRPDLGGAGYPRWNTDANARQVPIVATGDLYKYIGRLVAGFDAAGNLISVDPVSGPVRVSGVAPDAVTPDATMLAQVTTPVQAGVTALQQNIIGVTQVGLDGTRVNIRARETNLGNVAADSLLWQATLVAPQFGAPLPDVGLQNSGGIRNNNVIGPGNVSEFDTFSILAFNNFVCVVPGVPAAQFKEILENAVSRVAQQDGRFAQVAGFRMVWDANGVAQIIDPVTGAITVPGTRVREVVLNDGTVIVRNGQVVPGARALNVATIDFSARGGDQYPFNGRPFITLGVTYQQALRNYIQQWLGGSITSQNYPVGGEGRIIRVN